MDSFACHGYLKYKFLKGHQNRSVILAKLYRNNVPQCITILTENRWTRLMFSIKRLHFLYFTSTISHVNKFETPLYFDHNICYFLLSARKIKALEFEIFMSKYYNNWSHQNNAILLRLYVKTEFPRMTFSEFTDKSKSSMVTRDTSHLTTEAFQDVVVKTNFQ